MQSIYNLAGGIEGGLYLLAAFFYLSIAVLMLISWRRSGPGTWLVFACLMTALWGVHLGLQVLFPETFQSVWLLNLLESTRALAWAGFIYSIFQSHKPSTIGTIPNATNLIDKLPSFITALIIVLNLILVVSSSGLTEGGEASGNLVSLHFSSGVLMLVLTLGLYWRSKGSYRSAIILFVAGIVTQIVYDLSLNINVMAGMEINAIAFVVRPGIALVMAPILMIAAARNPSWKLNLSVSRRGAIYSLTLVVLGLYLIIVSFLSVYLGQFGGTIGDLITTVMIFLAGLFFVVLVSSAGIRRWFRRFVSEHFLAYTYDYREEWLKFVQTVSESSTEGLQVRIIRAMANLVGSPGGSLWLVDEGREVMRQESAWAFGGGVPGIEMMDSAFSEHLQSTQWLIELDELRDGVGQLAGVKVPDWVILKSEAWLVVPLIRRDELLGMVILERKAGLSGLNWEEQDILGTVAAQSASYLSEQLAEKALAETAEYRDFSERFSFAVHDIKNVSSQLGLMVKNAERHIRKPEFQEDMLGTLGNMATKLNMLLSRLDDQRSIDLANALDVELCELLTQVRDEHSNGDVQPAFVNKAEEPVWITGAPGKMLRIVGHLVQNAIEAVDHKDGKVQIELNKDVQHAIIKIKDNGRGMSPDFMARKLFKPFYTTKKNGYGLGMVECRRVVTQHRGELRVASGEGKGSIMEIRLPLSIRSMYQSGAVAKEETPLNG